MKIPSTSLHWTQEAWWVRTLHIQWTQLRQWENNSTAYQYQRKTCHRDGTTLCSHPKEQASSVFRPNCKIEKWNERHSGWSEKWLFLQAWKQATIAVIVKAWGPQNRNERRPCLMLSSSVTSGTKSPKQICRARLWLRRNRWCLKWSPRSLWNRWSTAWCCFGACS